MTSTIYTELLLNIRQLTVFISLTSNSNKDTKLELIGNGDSLVVFHEGQKCSINLPVGLVNSTLLKLPNQPTKDFSIRLPAAKGSAARHAQKTSMPWSAQALEGATEFKCRACGHSLAQIRQDHEWKDLPAENWAEMMDFWHCHKPDNPEVNTGDASIPPIKGYAATNKLVAQSGVGFVNVNSVLLSPENCSGVKLSQSCDKQPRRPPLICQKCNADSGFVDEQAGGWAIYAWSISVSINSLATSRSWPLEPIISAQLLGMVDHQATRKFLIRSDNDGDQGGILLWVFTPDMYYSSSSQPNGPLRVLKVFYREVTYVSDILKQQNLLHEDLSLPCNTVTKLREILNCSNILLPASLRNFQDWNVALLEKFNFYEGPSFSCLDPQ